MTAIIIHSQADAETKLNMESENTEVNIVSDGRHSQNRNTICHTLGNGESASKSNPLSYVLGFGHIRAVIPRPTARATPTNPPDKVLTPSTHRVFRVDATRATPIPS